MAIALLALSSILFQAQAQDIEIPKEFLEDDPPPPIDLEGIGEPETTPAVPDLPPAAPEPTESTDDPIQIPDLDLDLDLEPPTEELPGEDEPDSTPGDDILLPDLDLDDISIGDEESLDLEEENGGDWLHPPTVTLTGDYFGYFGDSAAPGDDHLVRGDLMLKFEGQIGEDFAYTVSPRFRQDSDDNGVNALELRENFERRPLATFHEAYLQWQSEKFQLSVGKQIFNWGVSDAYNPIDDLNSRDFLDVPTHERIGAPAISAYHLNDHFELQAVWQPWFTPSRIPLPGINNRWLGDFRALQARAAALLGVPPGFRFAGRNLPADQLENSQFGARISSSTLVDGWDLALTYFRGRSAEGVFVGNLIGGTLVASVEYPRYHEFGASFATVLGPWQLHGEGSWHLTDKHRLDDDYIEYVAGVNRSFSDTGIPLVEEVRLIFEYAGQQITRGLPAGSNSSGSRQFARPFENALASSVTLKFSEETELECSGAYDFADNGATFSTSVAHEVTDNMEVQLGADFFSGAQDSFFGKWDANDRIFLTLALTY